MVKSRVLVLQKDVSSVFDRVLNTALDGVFNYKLGVWHLHMGSPFFNNVDLLVVSPIPLFSSRAFFSKSHGGSSNISFSVTAMKLIVINYTIGRLIYLCKILSLLYVYILVKDCLWSQIHFIWVNRNHFSCCCKKRFCN